MSRRIREGVATDEFFRRASWSRDGQFEGKKLSWLGSLLVLIHAGIHFNAILPWLATVAMGINVISGLVGKMLLQRSREHVQSQRDSYQLRGLSRPEVEQAVFWDSVTFDAMTQWRKVHIPIFIVFAVLSLGHIISVFLFWGWQ